MFEIKKDPTPPEALSNSTGQAWRTKYPFRSMEVGDYFDVHENKTQAQQAACKAGARNGIKFTTRLQANGALRIWRVQ